MLQLVGSSGIVQDGDLSQLVFAVYSDPFEIDVDLPTRHDSNERSSKVLNGHSGVQRWGIFKQGTTPRNIF
jgi:hypothetical protein